MIISDVVKYKNKIMNKLLQTQDIITLLNNPDATSNPDLLAKDNIFPYIKIPDTTTEAKNYICFDYNTKPSRTNDTYKTVLINIVAVCHKSKIMTDWGARHDVLGGVLIELFNKENILGFQLELVGEKESIWEKDYYARELQFTNLTLNSFKNGVKPNGIR